MEKKTVKVIAESGKVFVVGIDGKKELVEYRNYWKAIDVASAYATTTYNQAMWRKEDIVNTWSRIGDELGCSAASVARQLNCVTFHTYVKPNERILNRLARVYGGRRSVYLANEILNNIELIRAYQEDDLNHISAFGMLGLNAKSAKAKFGKNLWKRLCSNSMSRNDMIVKAVCHLQGAHTNSSDKMCDPIEIIGKLNEIPSTLLKTTSIAQALVHAHGLLHPSRNIVLEILSQFNAPLSKFNFNKVTTEIYVINDTHSMIGKLGRKFNGKWSLARINKEHHDASAELLARKYGPTPFPYINDIPSLITRDDGYTAVLADSPMALYKIGTREMHCVHTYTDQCLNGSYIVYDITDVNGVHSTLGFGSHHYDQHMYARNQMVGDQCTRKKFADYVSSRAREVYNFDKKNKRMPAPMPAPVALEYLEPDFNPDAEIPF